MCHSYIPGKNMPAERHPYTNHPKRLCSSQPCLMGWSSRFIRAPFSPSPLSPVFRQSYNHWGWKGPQKASGAVQMRLLKVQVSKNLQGWRQHRLCAICSAVCLSYFQAPCLWKNPKLPLAGCTEMVTKQQWKNLRAKLSSIQFAEIFLWKYEGNFVFLLKMTREGNRISFSACFSCPSQWFTFL